MKDGICVALSLDWLATRFGISDNNYKTNDHVQNTVITTALAPVQRHYMIDLKPSTPGTSARMEQMAKRFELAFAKFKVPVDGTDADAIKSLVALLDRSNAGDHFLLVLQMDVGRERRSHATGIERGMASGYFFDPGVGEYKINKQNFQDFFDCYFRLKAKRWTGSNLIISLYSVSAK